MARVQEQSDRSFSADTRSNADDVENMARLLEQGEVAELFDSIARARFGKMISTAILNSAKRH